MVERICSFPDCGRRMVWGSLCISHGEQRHRGESLRPVRRRTRPAAERFWEKVRESSDGCWLWTSSVAPGGYGKFWADGALVPAHRWSYEALRCEIPEGLQLDHLCRTTSCVNPWHLEPVSQSENIKRIPLSPTCSAGHDYTPENTYINPSSGQRFCRVCVKRKRQHAA